MGYNESGLGSGIKGVEISPEVGKRLRSDELTMQADAILECASQILVEDEVYSNAVLGITSGDALALEHLYEGGVYFTKPDDFYDVIYRDDMYSETLIIDRLSVSKKSHVQIIVSLCNAQTHGSPSWSGYISYFEVEDGLKSQYTNTTTAVEKVLQCIDTL